MKTYIKTTLTILISGMLFSSCEDQLNQANLNQATEDTFWKDETDFNLALTSCYTPLKNALNGGYYGTRGVMLRIARADEVDFRNDISDVYTVNRFTNSNTNSLTQGTSITLSSPSLPKLLFFDPLPPCVANTWRSYFR